MTALPPGPRAPSFLQAARWFLRPIPLLEACARRYGDCFTLRFGSVFPPYVLFSDPQACKEIFALSAQEGRGGEANAFLTPFLREHTLVVLDGEEHRRHRRLLSPSFHGRRLHAYAPAMQDVIGRSVSSWPQGEVFALQSAFESMSLEVICRTVFGIGDAEDVTPIVSLMKRLLTLGSFPLMVLPVMQRDLGRLSPWNRIRRLRDALDGRIAREVARRRSAGLAERPDVLSTLLRARDEEGNPLTDDEILHEMIALLARGSEITASVMTLVVYAIASHPDVEDRVRGELRDVAGEDPIDPDQLDQLRFLEATIHEALRLWPPFPFVGRVLQRPLSFGGRELPAGAAVSPCIYLVHRRPDLWPDPEAFRPDRFLERTPSPHEFLPFGGGLRHCLGAAFAVFETKLAIAEVLRRTSLRIAPGYRFGIVRRGAALAAAGGLPVSCEHTSRA